MKRFEEIAARIIMYISTGVIIGLLLMILYSITSKGISSLSFEMLTQTPKGGYYLGRDGGIFNAIAGTLFLAFGATLLALFISFPVTLYINVFLKKK